jgi:hypothetical protein
MKEDTREMRKLGMEDRRGKKGEKKYINKSSRHINGNKEGRKQKKIQEEKKMSARSDINVCDR